MTYTPKAKFTGKETPQEFARKVNDELLLISRAKFGGTTVVQGVAGSSGGGGGFPATPTTPSWSRYFMTMGA